MLRRRTLVACSAMKWMSGSIAAGMVVMMLMLALKPGWLQGAIKSHPYMNLTAELPTGTRYWMLWVVASTPMAVTIAILFQLFRLFSFFRREAVFFAGTIGALRRIGLWLIALAPLMFLTRTLTVLIASWDAGPGARRFSITFNLLDFLVLAFGVVMLVMAVALQEALRLDEENRQIV
jgi:hypothetical protein